MKERAEIRTQIERDLEQSDSLSARFEDPVVSASGDVAWVAADALFEVTAGGESLSMSGRMTAVFQQRDGEWLLAQSHASVPMAEQAEGESFPT